jgi:hypothetical protein
VLPFFTPWLSALENRFYEVRDQLRRNGDRGDISITTVIIWVAAVTGALLIAGTIGMVIAKYNSKLAGI